MKTNNLTQSEHQHVHNFAKEIRKQGFIELDQYRIREDFHGLYNDIVQELNMKSNGKIGIFYELSEIIDEIFEMITPEMAYSYGKTAKQAGVDEKQGFIAFMYSLNKVINENELTKKRDELFYDLCAPLSDSNSLLMEFVEMHARMNVEAFYIDRFFNLGYMEAG